ncbi:MAG: PDZ domain-containing protein [Candidatus Sumerlaeota bacterium]|nr:PDZ domain-containing protein [Candidatus Sumerlaeota bacterium]
MSIISHKFRSASALVFAAAFLLMTSAARAYEGIGISLARLDNNLYVINVFPNSPAAKAGIQSGDMVFSVEDKAVQDLTTTQAVLMMRGARGTQLNVKVRHRGSQSDTTVIIDRDEVEIPEEVKKLIPEDQLRDLEKRAAEGAPATLGELVFALFSKRYSLDPGEKFEVIFLVSNPGGQQVDHWQARLRFDPEALEFLGYYHEDLARAQALDVQSGEGLIQLRPRTPAPRLLEDGPAAVLVFRAKNASGAASLVFERGPGATYARWKDQDMLGASEQGSEGLVDVQFEVAAAAAAAAVPSTPARPPKIRLAAVAAPDAPQRRRVQLILENPDAVPVTRINLTLMYDPAQLRVLDTDKGNWIRSGVNISDGPYHKEFPFDFHNVNAVEAAKGLVLYDMGAMRQPITAQGVFAHADFEATGGGAGGAIVLLRQADIGAAHPAMADRAGTASPGGAPYKSAVDWIALDFQRKSEAAPRRP